MKYPILRSGFITFTMLGLKQPNQPVDATAMAILGKQRSTPDNDNFYHQNIQTLFVQSIKIAKEGGMYDLAYQENVLKAAVEAFGTKNLFDWIELQSNNPDITSTHQAFILETLGFIAGKARKLHVSQWIRLLEASPVPRHGNIRNTDYFDKLKEIRNNQNVPHKLTDVMVKWIRQENGFYDFVMSLEAIFGNRRILSVE